MGIVADAALKNGGHVIGVIPQSLVIKEVVHEKLPDLRVVKNMHERKALIAELSDGFIALPGGYGTFEEFCEVLAWGQLGYHQKPFGLLDAAGFYRGPAGIFRPRHARRLHPAQAPRTGDGGGQRGKIVGTAEKFPAAGGR